MIILRKPVFLRNQVCKGCANPHYQRFFCESEKYTLTPPNWIDPIEPIKNTCYQEVGIYEKNLGLRGGEWGSGENGKI
ncbi:hypothetical protein BCD67_22165 [Oscillatoriales cyanobacterium USR001]|nr:hypothetical protein BCD67_22165 [Oscillatoriales cyanobacterium USR001]